MQKKDPAVAAVLGFLFGGFGLFYISVGQGFAAIAVLIVISLCTGGVGTVPMWIGCAVWGYLAAESYNSRVNAFLLEDEQIAEFRAAPALNGSVAPREPSRSVAPVRTAEPRANAFCIQCGGELRAGARFCGGCGSSTE